MVSNIENQVTATFRIVTPMFLGGTDKQAEEIRPASVKGMLRFWWRALNWSRYRNQTGATDTTALKELHDEEARLFGSAASDVRSGQGVFLLSVQSNEIKLGRPDIIKFSPLHYMAGQGVVFQKDSSKDRNALLSGSFSVRLRFRDSSNNDQRASIVEALQLFGLVGGMGSRVRRGFGSIALISVQGVSESALPQTIGDYQKYIGSLLGDKNETASPFTAFTSNGSSAFTQVVNNPIKVIELIGNEMGLYRGYGNNGKTFGRNAERNFKSDHDEMLVAAQGKAVTTAPKRLIFGIPHNYFFSSIKKSAQIQKTSGKLERRASPLMVHVHPIGNQYIGVLLLMRSAFLPDGEKILIGRSEVQMSEDWKVVERFMQRSAFTQGVAA